MGARRRNRSATVRAATVVVLACLVGACAPKARTCLTFRRPLPAPPDSLQVTFLGVGGVLVRWSGASVMTGPFYSNPSMPELAWSDIHSDIERVDRLMHQDVSDTRAVLVGHSHFDHAMDVPFVALCRAKSADILGNNALKKTLAPIESGLAAKTPATRVIPLEGWDPCIQAHVVPGTRFAIRAIHSEHSPQAGPGLVKRLLDIPEISLWRGEPLHPRVTMPTRAGEWPAGTTLAFLIDLLEKDGDAVAFRIYYQDSPTRTGVGYPPPCLGGRRVDLAILTVAGSSELPSFPTDIVEALEPRFVMGVHWEDFFVPRPIPTTPSNDVSERIRLAPGVSLSRFLGRVARAQSPGGQASVPCPDATTVFVRTGTSWVIAETDAAWSKPGR